MLPAVQVVDGVDGRLTGVPEGWQGTAGSWGCLAAHRRVLESMLNAGVATCAIFEDDAEFCPQFAEKLMLYLQGLPSDWEQAYLGGQHLLPSEEVTDRVVRCRNTNRTHAYLLNGQATMRKVLAHLYREDHRQARKQGHFDYWLGEMHEHGLLKAYAPTRWLVGQRPATSDVAKRPVLPVTMYWNRRAGPAARVRR